jgi:hypothetical protein
MQNKSAFVSKLLEKIYMIKQIIQKAFYMFIPDAAILKVTCLCSDSLIPFENNCKIYTLSKHEIFKSITI